MSFGFKPAPFTMSSHARCVTPDLGKLQALPPIEPYAHLIESLSVLVRDFSPSSSIHDVPRGLFTGPTSVAYLFLWLSKLYPSRASTDSSATLTAVPLKVNRSSTGSSLVILSKTPREWCKSYLNAAHTSHARHPSSSKAGGIQDETLAYYVVKAAFYSDDGDVALENTPTSSSTSRQSVERALRWATAQLPSTSSSKLRTPDESISQWLNGRAGTLYLLRLLTVWVPWSCPMVEPVIKAYISSILDQGGLSTGTNVEGGCLSAKSAHFKATNHDWGWSWQGKPYLGAVYGDAGILAQLILSDPARLAAPLEPLINDLINEQLPSGNWSSQRRWQKGLNGQSAPVYNTKSDRDELVQFCHGAPGVVIALQAVRKHMSQETMTRIDQSIAKAQEVMWTRGCLTKEPCLCHGIIGNALAMTAEGGDIDESTEDTGTQEDRMEDIQPQPSSLHNKRNLLLRMATPSAIRSGILHHATFIQGSDAYGLLWGEAGRAWAWAVIDGEGRCREDETMVDGDEKKEADRVWIGKGIIGFSDI